MANPCPHVAVVLAHCGSSISLEQVELPVLAIHGKTVLLRNAFYSRRGEVVLIVREIFELELVAKCRYFVIGQLDGRILMSGVHLDPPSFFLVGNQGDVYFRAAIFVDGCQ